MSNTGQTCLLLFAFIAGSILAGCDVEEVAEIFDEIKNEQNDEWQGHTNSTTNSSNSLDANTITIASFNIKVFGQSKLKKSEVMDVLARVVRNFDMVAIQEIRSRKNDVIPRFVELINSSGRQYDFVVGERLGRTSSKEQYAYVFDTSRIAFISNSAYTVPDSGDRLHREPMVASFRAQGQQTGQAFSFTLVNIHTDPDEAGQEVDALDDAFLFVREQNPFQDDVILLGDLNVDADRLGELGQLPNITWTVPATTPTNTLKTESYDNILFDQSATTEFTGRSGVLDLESFFGLTREEALRVSDHLPVWAEFSAVEGGTVPQIATRPDSIER